MDQLPVIHIDPLDPHPWQTIRPQVMAAIEAALDRAIKRDQEAEQ